MIIWIVLGFKHRGKGEVFLGACLSEEACFSITNKYSGNEYEIFRLFPYDVKKSRYVNSSKTVWPEQKYSADGHLDPISNRDKEGLCRSREIWGPYCPECHKALMRNFELSPEALSQAMKGLEGQSPFKITKEK